MKVALIFFAGRAVVLNRTGWPQFIGKKNFATDLWRLGNHSQ